MRRMQRFPFTRNTDVISKTVMSTCSESCNQTNLNGQQILGMNMLKILFQYSTYNGKETPFRSEMDKTTSSKQTRSSNARK